MSQQVAAKKRYGQNFISDGNLINKILNLLGEEKNSLVIEIGPGTGALTTKLVKRFAKVIAIEIDQEMETILKEKISDENFELIIADVLEIDLRELIGKQTQQFDHLYLISNTPYYITGEILFKTLHLNDILTKAVFMLQKEVALRLCAGVNENNYNNLSIACAFFAQSKYEFLVNKKMFRPIPKVDSAVVSLTFHTRYLDQVVDKWRFLDFVRTLFNNRRKTILNNLTRVVNNKTKAAEILTQSGVDWQLRPENLTLENYLAIFNLTILK